MKAHSKMDASYSKLAMRMVDRLFTERQRKILSFLNQKNGQCSVEDLAIHFNISQRSIRNDIKMIQLWCEQNQVEIGFKNSMLTVNALQNDKLKKILANDLTDDVMNSSPLTRQLNISFAILMSDEQLHLHELADEFLLSKSTIASDMKQIAEWFTNLNISLRSGKNGYAVHCSELQRRMAMISVLEWIRFNDQSSKLFDRLHWVNLSHKDLEYSQKWFDEHIHLFQISDFPIYEALLVQLERAKGKNYISDLKKWDECYEGLTSPLFEILKVVMPEQEYQFLELVSQLYSHKIIQNRELENESNIQTRLNQLNEHLGIGSFAQDTKQMLALEMVRLERWQEYGLYRLNPMFPLIYKKYKVIFQLLDKLALEYEETKAIPIHIWTEIVLLLAGEMEAQVKESSKINILLVCPNGSATSFFLEKRLQRHFGNITIVRTLSVENFYQLRHTLTYDLVISTVHLDTDDTVLVIPPLFDERQLEKIYTTIRMVEKDKILSNETIWGLIPTDKIIVKKEIQSIEKLLYEGVHILKQKFVTEEAIQQKMLEVLHQFGLYYEIMPGLIMPHIVSSLVQEVCMSLTCLEKPLSINGKKIYASITFVTPDKHAHIEPLKKLYEYLSKIDDVQEICKQVIERSAIYES